MNLVLADRLADQHGQDHEGKPAPDRGLAMRRAPVAHAGREVPRPMRPGSSAVAGPDTRRTVAVLDHTRLHLRSPSSGPTAPASPPRARGGRRETGRLGAGVLAYARPERRKSSTASTRR